MILYTFKGEGLEVEGIKVTIGQRWVMILLVIFKFKALMVWRILLKFKGLRARNWRNENDDGAKLGEEIK